VTQLAFVIPTWNRQDHLYKCLESISSQIGPEDDVEVIVVDDASDVPLRSYAEKLADGGTGESLPAGVKIKRRDAHTEYSAAFRDMMRAAPHAEWVWTFGDDDLLRPGALKFMLEWLPKIAADFIHVTEAKRASGVNNIYHATSMFDLANKFGWIEMTGYITGNLTRGAVLAAAAETPRWNVYARSAFVQSCALIDVLADRPATFMDVPLISSQDNENSEQTWIRWRDQNIPGRYLHLVDALECMYDAGVLKKRVTKEFFRYLNYHLWDRFLTHFASDYLDHGLIWSEDAWGRLMRFAQFVADEEFAKELLIDIEAARGLCTLANYMGKNLEGLRAELAAIRERRGQAVYPYSFVAPAETPAAST
jgi:glycosyltransferase involved in cell wall biosynthesis